MIDAPAETERGYVYASNFKISILVQTVLVLLHVIFLSQSPSFTFTLGTSPSPHPLGRKSAENVVCVLVCDVVKV